jgi:NAD+ synthase
MFSTDALDIDPATESARIESAIRDQVLATLRRRGAVLGLSGGVDSSLVACLCARALGPDRVVALLMPERESSSDSMALVGILFTQLPYEQLIRRAPDVRGDVTWTTLVE